MESFRTFVDYVFRETVAKLTGKEAPAAIAFADTIDAPRNDAPALINAILDQCTAEQSVTNMAAFNFPPEVMAPHHAKVDEARKAVEAVGAKAFAGGSDAVEKTALRRQVEVIMDERRARAMAQAQLIMQQQQQQAMLMQQQAMAMQQQMMAQQQAMMAQQQAEYARQAAEQEKEILARIEAEQAEMARKREQKDRKKKEKIAAEAKEREEAEAKRLAEKEEQERKNREEVEAEAQRRRQQQEEFEARVQKMRDEEEAARKANDEDLRLRDEFHAFFSEAEWRCPRCGGGVKYEQRAHLNHTDHKSLWERVRDEHQASCPGVHCGLCNKVFSSEATMTANIKLRDAHRSSRDCDAMRDLSDALRADRQAKEAARAPKESAGGGGGGGGRGGGGGSSSSSSSSSSGPKQCRKCKGGGVVDCSGCKGKGTWGPKNNNVHDCGLGKGSGRMKCGNCGGSGMD